VLSGGGRTTVATDRMLTDTRRLHALADAAEGWAGRVHRAVEVGGHGGGLRWNADDPEPVAMQAYAQLRQVQHLGAELAHDLHAAAENYGAVERANRDRAENVGAAVAWLAGHAAFVHAVAALATPFGAIEALVGLAGGFAVATGVGGAFALGVSALVPGDASPKADLVTALKRSRLLCSAPFVRFLRTLVSSVDDAELGALGVPFVGARVLDDDDTGWFGLRGAAGTLVALSGPTLLKETPVAVDRAGTERTAAPRGFADLAARIPKTGEGKPQVRIEKYEHADGRPGWIVLVGGTADGALTAGDEPWDDVSNVQAVGQLDPGSVRATLRALDDAGVGKDDPIVFAGYSQGGIVTQEAITRGGYTHASQFTMGSPVGQMPLPDGVQDVSVEIAEDPIPALGGEPLTPAHGGLDRTLVTRSIYSDSPAPTDSLLPAHDIAGYRETATMMDASDDPRLVSLREKIAEATGAGQTGSGASAPGEVTLWHAARVHPGAAPAVSAGSAGGRTAR